MDRRGLLGELSDATRASLLDAGTRTSVAAGAFLVQDGDDSTTVFVVLDGLLKVVKSSLDGEVSFLGLRRAGSIVGELAVLAGSTRASSMQAVEPTEVVRIDAPTFDRLLDAHADLRRALLGELAGRLREATMQLHDLMNADARTRLASRLVQLADETAHGDADGDAGDDATIALPISQEELADWAGLSRAGAVKALRSLRDDGLIETGRMAVSICDVAELRRTATV